MFTYKNWEKVCISFSNKGKCGKTAIEVLDKKNTDGFLIFKHDVETSPERALDIAKKNGKTIMLLPFLNPLIRFLMICPGKIGIITKKAFGNLVYDSSMSK